MNFFFNTPELYSRFSDVLTSFSNVAQVVIALANIFLAYYILKYQRRKDRDSEQKAEAVQKQTIQLQWFKELIIQPNLLLINNFYANLHDLRNIFKNGAISDEIKLKVNRKVKYNQVIIRKSFVDLLGAVDSKLAEKTKINLDRLIDHITEALFNTKIPILNSDDFEKHIGLQITQSRNELFAAIYNYKGSS